MRLKAYLAYNRLMSGGITVEMELKLVSIPYI